MSLREFIFVDDLRLDSYTEQIAPAVTYDKVPVYSASLGLVATGASTVQQRFARPLSQIERVRLLEKYLQKGRHLGTVRPHEAKSSDEHRWQQPFVVETCKAARVQIPAREGQPSFPGLVLWLSPPPPRDPTLLHPPGILCLLQDSRIADNGTKYGFLSSAYSVLESLILHLHLETRKTLLAPLLDFVGSDDESLEFHIDCWSHTEHALRPFLADPVHFLSDLGCHASRARTISSLYRVRDFGPEFSPAATGVYSDTLSTFGYPIFIEAA